MLNEIQAINDFNQALDWFPLMIIEKNLRIVNILIFLVENVYGKNTDVEADRKNRIVKLESLN